MKDNPPYLLETPLEALPRETLLKKEGVQGYSTDEHG
jgi:hypothetical protein